MVFDRMAEDQSSWPRIRIGDVAQVYDGPHATPTKTATGPIFLGISALNRGRLDLANTEHLSEEDFSKWTKRVVPSASDVVFSYETRIGEAAIIPKGLRCCLGRRMGLVRVDASRLDPHFFLYQYLSPTFQGFLHSRTIHGSTVDRIALKDFPDFEIDLPPLTVQRQIAKVMLDLDAKIDLNRRINQTLEAMAQAIFKSWFVDFDPVKAKIAAIEQGEDPLRAAMRAISGKTDAELDQMPREHHNQLAATAALFPDEMQESELGEIPKGWSFRQIAEFGEVVCGKTPAKSNPDYFGSGTPFIKIPDMHNNVYVTQSSEQLTVQGVASQPKKTIPPGSICVSCIATVGKVVLIHEPSQTNQQINSIIPRRPEYSFYLYFQMLEKQQVFLDLASGGSATLNMNTSIFSKVETLLPDDGVITKFSELVMPVFSQILANQKQADNLAGLRDTLLPKLLSGELSVVDLDKEVALS